ncbi:MAG: outer membrane protein assembly factor BamA [Calditrichia bacterium]
MRKIALILVVLMVSTLLLLGQAQKIKIKKVEIEGIRISDSTTVLINSGLLPNKMIGMEDIQKGIRNLWNLQIYSDVKILLVEQASDGVVLKIVVKEYPKIKGYNIVGSDKIDRDDIKKEVEFYKGGILSPVKLFKTKKNIIDKYKEKGFLLAKVNIDTTMVEDNQVLAVINIEEGKRIQVKKIRIHGLQELKEKDVKKQFKKIKEDRWWRSADFDPKKYEEDKENVLKFCQKKGFRDAEIVRDSISYNEGMDELYIDLWINEGKKYYFGNVEFSGNTVFTSQELSYELLFEKGNVYNQEEFEKTINEKIKKKYYDRGYLFAQIQPLEIPRNDTIDVKFNILEGEVYKIRKIYITGNTKTNEKVIRRELMIFPGDVFSQEMIERSMREVWVLNYFANVVPDVKFIPDSKDQVDLEFKIEEKSTDQANASVGYSAKDGPIGNIGFALTNFSLKHPFQMGDGQRLAFNWYFGKYYKSISLSFTEPWMFSTPTLGGFSVFDTRSGGGGVYPFTIRERGFSLTLGRNFRWPDPFFSGQMSFRFADIKSEENDLSSSSFNYYYPYYFGNRNSKQISLTTVISRDSKNRPEFPTAGSSNSLLLKLGGGPLGGTEDFLKIIFNSEWFIPTYAGFVVYLHGKIGMMQKLYGDSYINPGEYFYLGGSGLSYAEELRGYQEAGVLPSEATDGTISGGRAMSKFTTELRFPIAPNPTIYGLLFMEGGNVWNTFPRSDLFDLKRSVGAGIRLFMPMVGMIGIDFGYGLDRLNDRGQHKGKWELHFKFGRF